MSEYADWSPASVFGSTVVPSAPCKASSSFPGRLGSPNAKISPKKRYLTANPLPPNDLVTNNNDEEFGKESSKIMQQSTPSIARTERKRELAVVFLQRQVQVWLLRRQETLHLQEVQRLRVELRHAAVCVIRESYIRYAKRQAIWSYLNELGKYETRLDNLLQGCINRKRQMEAVQRFATLRRQQKQQAKDQSQKLVHEWLENCIQTRRQKRKQAIVNAHEKLLGWVRRWTLRKRCEARIITCAKEKHIEAQRRNCAQTILAFYRAYKLCSSAKDQIRQRRRLRDGLARLYETFGFAVLRLAQSRWRVRIYNLKMMEDATRKIQRVYREHVAEVRHARRVGSCLFLQRVFRGHVASVQASRIRQKNLQETINCQRSAAAIVIQRRARGYLTRVWFGEVLCKLRERFRCANCGAVEPGGTYCKYCGRHRTAVGLLSSVVLLHERWQLGRLPSRSLAVKAVEDPPVLVDEVSTLPMVVPSPKKPAIQRSRSASLRMLAISSSSEGLGPIPQPPVVFSPLHRRLAPHNAGAFARSLSLSNGHLAIPRRNSIASISEQTARRATALVTLQANITASAQANALEMHLTRLQNAKKAVHR